LYINFVQEKFFIVTYATFFFGRSCKTFSGQGGVFFMTQQQGQNQDQQNALQNEFPAGANSSGNEAPEPARGDTQTSQRADSWRPSEDPAIEQAGGITQPQEGEPGRSQQDGQTRSSATDTEASRGQGAGGDVC